MIEPARVFKLLDEALEAGREAALATVISTGGSTPRDSGANMLVFADGSSAGTVGGGKLEALTIKDSLAALKDGKNRRAVYDLTLSGIGMVCAGRTEVFIEVFSAPAKLLILGAGHVGLKIAEAAYCAGLPCAVADDRAEFANRERFPTASAIHLKRPAKAISRDTVDSKTYIVIVTRGHSLDGECLARAVKTEAAYIGMIGSASKLPVVYKSLNKKGLHPETDSRVYAPIGLDIGGKTPGEIAISVLSEILKVANSRSGGHMREAARKRN
ncbi:MAG: XdhC/CoxI family protein [Elusimicrobiales bacterium]|nr:XdhC/CoxI family protein [Elusimicrobiales bacterium]